MRVIKAIQYLWSIQNIGCYVPLREIDLAERQIFQENNISYAVWRSILNLDAVFKVIAHISGFYKDEMMKKIYFPQLEDKLDIPLTDSILNGLLHYFINKNTELAKTLYDKAHLDHITTNIDQTQINSLDNENLRNAKLGADFPINHENKVNIGFNYADIFIKNLYWEFDISEMDNMKDITHLELKRESVKILLLTYAIALKEMNNGEEYKLFLSTIRDVYVDEFNTMIGINHVNGLYPVLNLNCQSLMRLKRGRD